MYGSYIRAARERAGLTVADAAKAIGKGADLIYRIERDAADPSMDTLDRLAGAYGCLIGDLLPNSGAGGVTQDFEPLMTALYGLEPEEVRDQINVLAAQARIYRDALKRRTLRREETSVIQRPVSYSKASPTTEVEEEQFAYGTVPPSGTATESRANANQRTERSGTKGKARP